MTESVSNKSITIDTIDNEAVGKHYRHTTPFSDSPLFITGGIMMTEDTKKNEDSRKTMENFTIRLTNPMLYDKLHILSAEYSVSVELLVNTAVKRLLDDIDLFRRLRANDQPFFSK